MTDFTSILPEFQNETVAVAFHDLHTGREFFINADQPFHPASTIKVAVMMEVFNQVEKGIFWQDDELPIINLFKSIADGSMFSVSSQDDADTSLYDKIGSTVTIQELTRLMIVRSSNLATNLLIEKVSAVCVNALLKELEIDGVQVLRGVEDNKAFALGLNNSATARGLMQIAKLLIQGKAVSFDASEDMVNIMRKQEFNEGIPAGLPKEYKVAHKTGWNDKLYHDFGVVFPDRREPYVLAIMTSGFKKDEDAHKAVAEISKSIQEKVLA
jgi:beta-lactamase class A